MGFAEREPPLSSSELQVRSSLAYLSLDPGFLGTRPDSQHRPVFMLWLVSH